MARENALSLERICRHALNFEDRGALNGLIDANNINSVGMGYFVLTATLAPYFKDGNSEQRASINDFLSEFYSLSDTDTSYSDYNEKLGEARDSLRELLEQLNQ